KRIDPGRGGEPAAREVAFDRAAVVITVRRARQEARRVFGKERLQRARHDIGELVFLDPIPDVENENPAGPEHAPRLRKRLGLVGKEHHAELAYDGIELAVAEWERHRIRLAPLD